MRARLALAAESRVALLLDGLRSRLRDSILIRPAMFVAGGLVLAWLSIVLDGLLGPQGVPRGLRFSEGTARPLLITLSGATLTVAGITFWVRAASVQLAASQYSPRVVHGFLQDWFQQSMMGLLVGFFAFMVSVLRVLPDAEATSAAEMVDVPHLSVFLCVVLAGGSVLVVLVAIRNSVRSMQPGDLARRITDVTLEQIKGQHPRRGQAPGGAVDAAHELPRHTGVNVRSHGSGWVQAIREDALAAALPEGAIVRLEVRVGLFVVGGRHLCTVWVPEEVDDAAIDQVRDSIRLGRSRAMSRDIHYGIQQLVDVALGSLSHGTADAASAYEAIVHIEMVLRELLLRELPPSISEDELGRRILRPREFTFTDYVAEAFARLRLAVASHPTIVVALIESIGSLVGDLRAAGHRARIEPLLREGRLAVAACEAAGVLEEDLALVQRVAVRSGILTAEDISAS